MRAPPFASDVGPDFDGKGVGDVMARKVTRINERNIVVDTPGISFYEYHNSYFI